MPRPASPPVVLYRTDIQHGSNAFTVALIHTDAWIVRRVSATMGWFGEQIIGPTDEEFCEEDRARARYEYWRERLQRLQRSFPMHSRMYAESLAKMSEDFSQFFTSIVYQCPCEWCTWNRIYFDRRKAHE